MWVFKNNAFVSIVQDRTDSKVLWVRGRIHGDVERFLGLKVGDDRVSRTPSADYLFRAQSDREEVGAAMIDAVDGVDYANFKNSIDTTQAGDMRHTFYLRVWAAMNAYQSAFRQRFKK